MGDSMGGCGTHYYGKLTKEKVDAIIKELKNRGITLTGDNPWEADTHQSGVKLKGEYSEATMMLTVTITDCNWYVPGSLIWAKIDPLMRHILGMSDEELKAAISRSQTS